MQHATVAAAMLNSAASSSCYSSSGLLCISFRRDLVHLQDLSTTVPLIDYPVSRVLAALCMHVGACVQSQNEIRELSYPQQTPQQT